MQKETEEAKTAILDFLDRNANDLPKKSRFLGEFLDQVLKYLFRSSTLKSFAEQKAIVTGQLLAAEKAGNGSFSFVLEHNLDHQKGPVTPTIQISCTGQNFHALVIKRQETALEGYAQQQPLSIFGLPYQIALATNRIRADVNLSEEFPSLHSLKAGCRAQDRPVLYFLGAARQFPNTETTPASVIENQSKAINAIFSVIETSFGNNVVIGTGGWAGTQEGSLGIPRIGYLHAVTANRLILTTMPVVGAYDRHENPTLEVFCGQEWGDDSAVLAAACDGAFVFSPYGTWTQIEVENLLAQKKPFVVIDDPQRSKLSKGERIREVHAERGSYCIYANPEEAARDLLAKVRLEFRHPPARTSDQARTAGALRPTIL